LVVAFMGLELILGATGFVLLMFMMRWKQA